MIKTIFSPRFIGDERTSDSIEITTPFSRSETDQYLSSIMKPLEKIKIKSIVFRMPEILFDKILYNYSDYIGHCPI